MAYKINGTTVVDNSRNVCACCVTSCCITASSRMDAPSGNTASRPGSPATGSVYFDTDEGALVSYNGAEWVTGGGGFATTEMTPVSDWIGPYFQCVSCSTGTCGCFWDDVDTGVQFNPYTCQLLIAGYSCNCTKQGYVRYLTFTPSNCGVTYSCCSCPCCCGCNGMHRYPNYQSCCGCVLRIFGCNSCAVHFKSHSVFPTYCFCDSVYVMCCGTACDFCLCANPDGAYCYGPCCGGAVHCLTPFNTMCKALVTDDRCCTSFLSQIQFCCCNGTACTAYVNSWLRFNGPIPSASTSCCDPIPLVGMCGVWATSSSEVFPIHQFCNGLLYIQQQCGTNCLQCFAYMFMCNNGTSCNLNMPCQDGSCRCFFIAGTGGSSTYPTEWVNNGSFRMGLNFFGHELFGQRSSCAPFIFYSVFKHEFENFCFDATDQCVAVALVCNITCSSKSASMCCYGHCVPTCNYPLSVLNGQGITYTAIHNNRARFYYCNAILCADCFDTKNKLPTVTFFNVAKTHTMHNCNANPCCFFYSPTDSEATTHTLSAVKTMDPATLGTLGTMDALPYISDKVPSDYGCFTAKKCDHKYGPLPSYGVAPNANTCDMQLFCYVPYNITACGDAKKLHVAVSCICKQCCSVADTTAICKCAVYFRLYCG